MRVFRERMRTDRRDLDEGSREGTPLRLDYATPEGAEAEEEVPWLHAIVCVLFHAAVGILIYWLWGGLW